MPASQHVSPKTDIDIAQSAPKRPILDIAREKLCLQEVANKYLKIIGRWEQLEALSFDDPQLQEAS